MTVSVSPTSPGVRRSSFLSHTSRKSSGASQRFRRASFAPSINNDYNEEEDGSEERFGDDFDDFEEGADDADFDDFDDGFQEAELTSPPPQSTPVVPSFVSSESKNCAQSVRCALASQN